MAKNWLARLRQLWRAEEPPPTQPPVPTRPPLVVASERYQKTLEGLADDPQTLLSVLLARDQAEAALGQTKQIQVEDAGRLVDLDGRLRQQATGPALSALANWRQTLQPSNAHWWWFLDQKAEAREKESDLPWVLLTGTLFALTVPLALEIFKRLLVGAPDTLSIVGTLLTLTLTASPLFRRGRELAEWFFGRIPRLQPRFHAEAMAGMAVLAFLLVGLGWLSLPRLSRYYNNEGHDALRAGNLMAAQRAFQRAVALNPDLVVPYQNLADVYQRIGRPQEAQNWYQKAIERDLNFGPAYRGLGHLHNLEGDFEQAEQVLLAGLGCEYDARDADLETITRYQLLSDLGWAYLGQGRLELAQTALEAAVTLEDEVQALEERTGTQYRLALPHDTLAQVYEQSDRPQEALEQWEESLRFLDPENWADQERISTILDHIEQSKGDKP